MESVDEVSEYQLFSFFFNQIIIIYESSNNTVIKLTALLM